MSSCLYHRVNIRVTSERQMEVISPLGHTRAAKAVAIPLPYVNSDDLVLQRYSREALKELDRSDLIPKDTRGSR